MYMTHACFTASKVRLKGMGKIDGYQTTAKHDKAQAVSTIPRICCIIQEQTVTRGENIFQV